MWIIATPAGHQMNQLSYKANVPKLLSHPLSIALAKKSSTSLTHLISPDDPNDFRAKVAYLYSIRKSSTEMTTVKFFIWKKTWSKMVKHTCCGYSARFLTYVWPFFSVMKEKVKGLVMVARVLDARLLPSSHKNKAIRIHKYVCETSIRCKIQSFEEWLVEDASSPITQFQESELLSELRRNSMQRSLHTLKN